MGREVRRVPPGWEHPRDERGDYVPLYDGADLARDVEEYEAVEPEWRPDPARYMPAWNADEATAWCVYETVTEGTPASPVFDEPEALLRWLVEEAGYSSEAAARFLVDGWAPSFVVRGGVFLDGIEDKAR